MHVVATAGHVDHGKSTLVRALTGQDPDRLVEERRRGLSIELGYCWTTLGDVGEVAFVDVPGHERFIATTLAGLGPAPVAMLVVAADDPWMPQAAEHLAALDALGVGHGLLVVTRADLADPAPALARATAELGRTSLAGAPAVVVSGRTGSGLPTLRATLASVLQRVPAPDPDADVRLWVDRRFHVRGAGTVVTGTLVSGTVAVGDELAAAEGRVRVRGLEALGTRRQQVPAPARVALDLGGRAPDGVTRGTALLTPEAFLHSDLVDVALVGPPEVPERPVLHVGTARVSVRARRLGDRVWRLALATGVPLRVGDRAVLRDPGSRATWGVEVIDPVPPPLRRRGAAAARAEQLQTTEQSVGAELARRGIVRASQLHRAGVAVGSLPPGTVAAGDWLVGPELADELRRRLVALVEAAEDCGLGGVAPLAAARSLQLPDPALVDALRAPPLRVRGGRLTTGRGAPLPAAALDALARLSDALAREPFAAPEAGELARLGVDDATTGLLHRTGHVLRLAPGVVLLPGAVDTAVARLGELPQPFSVSEARRALGTTRRVAVPLLGHLDATGRTIRLPDDRRRVRMTNTAQTAARTRARALERGAGDVSGCGGTSTTSG